MESFERLPLDTLKMLFSMLDINQTVCLVEARYINSGLGRAPISSAFARALLALLFMRFEAVPSVRKLCRRLKRRSYARDIARASKTRINTIFNHLFNSPARVVSCRNPRFCLEEDHCRSQILS